MSECQIAEKESSQRQRRLRNLSEAIRDGLDEEIKNNKANLMSFLNQNFIREIKLAESCVYEDDTRGAIYHGFVADMIHRSLEELEVA